MNPLPGCIVLRSIIVATLIAGLSMMGLPARAYAHDGPPRLELSTDRVNPGALIEVRGINLASQALITIVLVHNEFETQLGQVMSNAEGDFIQTLALLVDLTEGDYTVRAVSQGQTPVGAPLRIEGAAIAEEGEQRDEEEALLAPMPTRAPSVASPSSQTAAAPQTAVAGENYAAWLFLPLGTLALAGLALVIKRRSVQ